MKKSWLVLGLSVVSLFFLASSKAADKTTAQKQKTAPAAQATTPAPSPAQSGVLDGRSFQGEMGAKGKKADPDTFIFKNGRFTSTACEKFGFKDAAYTTSGEGKHVRFRATTFNPSGAKLDWDGTVKGNTVRGTAILNQPGKPPVENRFKGKITK